MVSGGFKRIMFIEFVEQEAELMWQCKQRGVPVNTGEALLAHLPLTFCCVPLPSQDRNLYQSAAWRLWPLLPVTFSSDVYLIIYLFTLPSIIYYMSIKL